MQNIVWMTEDYPPYNFLNKGKITGIATELLRALYRSVQQPFPEQNLAIYPWPRAYFKLQHEKTLVFFQQHTHQNGSLNFNFLAQLLKSELWLLL